MTTDIGSTDSGADSPRRSVLRTLTLLLLEAMDDPGQLKIAYSVGDGYFFHVNGGRVPLPGDVERVRRRMQARIESDQPLELVTMKRAEALKALLSAGRNRTADWLADRPGPARPLAKVKGELYLLDGPLLRHPREIGEWELLPYPPGLLLRIPPKGQLTLGPVRDLPALFRSFYENEMAAAVHGVNYVSEVNRRVDQGERAIGELLQVAEAGQEKAVAHIAERIAATLPRPRVVLVSGPSSSGKTSFSHRLATHLRLLGLAPQALGLDNFYRPRNEVPRTETGDYDFEALEALDVELFNEVLLRLIAGEQVLPPLHDFRNKRRRVGTAMQLAEQGILIVEGIHGLNPRLTPHLTAPSVFKVYVSALTSLNLDRFNRVSTADLRLLRRIVRDRRARGYPTAETLMRWPVVRAGELRHIFPWQEHADAMFNSALPYELSALKPQADEALAEIKGGPFLPVARRLRQLLSSARPIDPALLSRHLPPTSILAEFLGGSVLAD